MSGKQPAAQKKRQSRKFRADGLKFGGRKGEGSEKSKTGKSEEGAKKKKKVKERHKTRKKKMKRKE